MTDPIRCQWATHSPEEREYHDNEWGVPVREDRRHFEFLILESAQAGLSWLTILRKREGYRRLFAGFDPVKVAVFGPDMVESLLQDASIIRNRKKIQSAVTNAKAFLELQKRYGSFNDFIWDFVGGRPVQNAWKRMEDVPPTTPLSNKLAKELKSRGFTFLGSTTLYAHMQASGLVNDHITDCFRYEHVRTLGLKF